MRSLIAWSILVAGAALTLITVAAWAHSVVVNQGGGELRLFEENSPGGRGNLLARDYDISWSRRSFQLGWASIPPQASPVGNGPWRLTLQQREAIEMSDDMPQFLGLGIRQNVGLLGVRFSRIYIPYWASAAIGIALSIWGFRARRRQASKPGLCTKCGYDIRATRNKCPECGTAQTRQVTP